ncbi:hypothetical protein HDV03_003947 [Kappamyces sp. JEL0829]|nr:hypothetical protein HDV03_003947 [Kappamyces sp. JEL0829]
MIAILGGGAISGLIVAGVGLPRKDVRLWPETLQERRLLAPGSTQFQTLKLAASHALFWTVYSGLQNGIRNARDKAGTRAGSGRDVEDAANDFGAGFVAGLVYRAGSVAYSAGPAEAALTLRTVGGTGLRLGLACALLETADVFLQNEFRLRSQAP